MKHWYFPLFVVCIFGFNIDAVAQCGTTPITGDLIISSNTSLSGTYNITGLFRVEPGVVCSVSPYTSGGCGELTINAATIEVLGDILADGAGYPGGSGGAGGSTGNNSGALTGCVDKDNCLVIDVNGGAAGAVGSGPGAGASGNGGSLGMGPKQQCQNFGDEYGFVGGAGGAGGSGGGSYGGPANSGGAGGAGAAYNSGNFSGMGLAGCASPSAGNGGTGGIVGSTYGTATGIDIDLGSGGAGGGGGGKSASNGLVGGLGGAGGGLIHLNSSGALIVAGTISANGGSGGIGGVGGDGGTTTDCCSDACNDCAERTFSSGAGGGGGAGGGSGGGILLQAFGDANITGTLRTLGGNGGTGGSGGVGTNGCTYSDFFCGSNSGNANAGASGNLGGGGSGGRIKIFQNPCATNNINASVLLGGGSGNVGQAAQGTYHLGTFGNIVPPTVSTSADSVSCFGLSDGQATVVVNGGTAPFSYSWSPIGGNSATAVNLPAGSYDVTVVDSNNCTVTQTVVVPEPDLLTAQVFGVVDADCYGFSTGEASAMGLGGTMPYSYAWNDPALQIAPTATGLPAGTWDVQITDANGCTATGSATVGQPGAFSASLSIDQNVSCNGGSDGQATVTANGIGLTYLWNDPLGQTNPTATNLPAGTWTCTVASSQTCDTVITVVIDEPALLQLIAVENQAVSCPGGSDGIAAVTQLGGTSPFNYQWNDPNLQVTPSASGLDAGVYTVVVTDANGCVENASVTITEPLPISIALNVDSADCNGGASGSIEAIVTGGTSGYTYEWNPGAVSGNPFVNVVAGTYSVTITDANGCQSSFQNIIVQQPLPIVLSLVQQQNVSCNGANDGQAEITALGGIPPYTYLWNDPTSQSTALAGGLAPGTYNVIVTDANGCTALWQNVNITEPEVLVVDVTSTTPITCEGGEDGMAETQVTGGTMPYTYAWNDPDNQTAGTAIGLAQGIYLVAVSDANGCTVQGQAVIDGPVNLLNADFSVSPETGLQPLEITITNNSVGGTAYQWIFGDGNTVTTYDTSSFQYTYNDSGMFSVTLVAYNDVTGCSDTLVFQNGIYVEPTSLILIPNVITPNGDGLNDIFPIDPTGNDFFPSRIRNIYDFVGTVYNRWGEKVYEWTQPLGGWDGRSTSGQDLIPGTYYYTITAKGVDGDAVTDYKFTGNITLIKD